ncbi:MAG: asparagine synthase (glutamine-hydrolyzing), partial [Ignavibacteria bacterium]|nr:asparagine synthase (glutamine-hydrolyzing) [Ignavibacteria bacterium]
MCGISGIFSFSKSIEENRVHRMNESVAHRGPDGEGMWKNEEGNLLLGHRRLSIIDLLPEGAQPMHYIDRYVIVYNGEIYNYIELKATLEKKGYIFKTVSDTEVLLAAYAAYGENMFEHLDGMFAFAIWDKKEKNLFCARDRFGEKPFYYHHDKNAFIFCSEIKGLFAAGIEINFDSEMIFNFLAYDIQENPLNKEQTFYTAIKKIEAAHYLIIKADGSIIHKKYWSLNKPYGELKISHTDAFEKFRELFLTSVKRRLRSDVPVGISLSGGLDSSTITTCINYLNSDNKIPVHT